MLSENLLELASQFNDYAYVGGVTMTPQALRTIASVLDALAEQAAGLERSAVAPAARLTELPDNVVIMKPRPRNIPIRMGRPSPDGAA